MFKDAVSKNQMKVPYNNNNNQISVIEGFCRLNFEGNGMFCIVFEFNLKETEGSNVFIQFHSPKIAIVNISRMLVINFLIINYWTLNQCKLENTVQLFHGLAYRQ